MYLQCALIGPVYVFLCVWCVCVCVCVGEEDQRSLEEFIGKFLKAVESNLCFEFSKYGKIKDLINGKLYQITNYFVIQLSNTYVC